MSRKHWNKLTNSTFRLRRTLNKNVFSFTLKTEIPWTHHIILSFVIVLFLITFTSKVDGYPICRINQSIQDLRIRNTRPSVAFQFFLEHSTFCRTKTKQRYTKNIVAQLFMATRDGKKKRPKQENSSDTPSASSSSASSATPPSVRQPQRVTNDINIPVRQQIEIARAKKEAMRMASTSFRANNVKTAYRKKMGECVIRV